jgi:hypothetical protein
MALNEAGGLKGSEGKELCRFVYTVTDKKKKQKKDDVK